MKSFNRTNQGTIGITAINTRFSYDVGHSNPLPGKDNKSSPVESILKQEAGYFERRFTTQSDMTRKTS
jgi:hypothetical protein